MTFLLFFIEKMIKDGTAYVDNTPTDVMRQERETKTPSKCRDKCKYLCNNPQK